MHLDWRLDIHNTDRYTSGETNLILFDDCEQPQFPLFLTLSFMMSFGALAWAILKSSSVKPWNTS